MTWPVIFGGLTGGAQPVSLFDGMYNQTAFMTEIPCSASGTSAISLTPLPNVPSLLAYSELGGYRFRATGSSAGPVTAEYNGLGFLPVYLADGVTQANVGSVVTGEMYILVYSAVMAGGLPGFFLGQDSVAGVGSAALGGTPGGRLTFQSATPVMTSNSGGPQQIYYAPYVNQFVPIWNGSTLQQYNFCSSLSDQVGLEIVLGASVSWPVGNVFDIFVTLNSGVPVLATVQWTTPTARATLLAIFGGMLTNATSANMRINSTTLITVPSNQGTFLGTFYSYFDGKSNWVYGAAASGGGAAQFGLCNYYNKVLFNTIVEDNGASYTNTSATVRQARASAGNQISYVQSDSERAAIFSYEQVYRFAAVASTSLSSGIGVTTTAFNAFQTAQNAGSLTFGGSTNTSFQLSSTGLTDIIALENSDGVNANTFDASSNNLLMGSIWL